MSKSPLHAFFLGRAIAEGIYERLEHLMTNALSELGKFDAEQRETMRQFTDKVLERAELDAQTEKIRDDSGSFASIDNQPKDLQALIDDLRAEVAQVRAELKKYRSGSA